MYATGIEFDFTSEETGADLRIAPKKICFDVSNAPGPSTFPDRSEIRPLVFSPRGKGRMEQMDSLRSRRILDLPATGSQASP